MDIEENGNKRPLAEWRRNLTPVSNVREAEPIFLFWGPNGRNESPEMRFEFLLILIGLKRTK